jgi:protein-L-isoaspartate(D-aspartate) O-methyltransferase
MDEDRAAERRAMVAEQLALWGIGDRRVLAAMAAVPRERFVPPDLTPYAYFDQPLPIGEDQTISQPWIVAAMAQAARIAPGDRVLEVGAGSGYAAAVLARLAAEVVAVERLPALVAQARARLADQPRVAVVAGDGTLGWPARAPFDAVLVSAGGPAVPGALLTQLAEHGRLVMPVGDRHEQRLLRVTRIGERFVEDDLGGVRFVPLIGAQGWEE